jgi:hypothetical protein
MQKRKLQAEPLDIAIDVVDTLANNKVKAE